MHIKHNSIIESLGVYLPPQTVSTGDVMRGCINNIQFPLENITGIKSRRKAGQDEFSIDLAGNAITDCLAKSKYNPFDIDLLICCNI
ncbi:MAG: 3-oxoacyl-ACP synthase, partial [Pedobacter sp.]